ncbi:MAG: RNA polymerase factor sigma-54, partial [Phycisphaerae bacterium]|nr:RNA polymerase factor sigma-54 [Phycisphaerae bacterium]
DQWRFVDAAEPVSRAGEHLIEFIDDDGYLRTGLEDVAERAPGGMTADHLAQALELIQAQLEPRGIGARDLKQCLLIQLDTVAVEPGEADALGHARLLVEGHLKDIELNRLPRIAQKTKLSLDEINRGLALLRRLDPRPGRQLAPPRVEMVVPDIIVEYDPVNDAYVSAIARGRQPALRINPGYARLATDKEQDRSTRKYLSNGVNQARWLIDAVEQRTNTVLRVANVVLAAQREFLDYGVEHLKPLPMVQVAEQLGIHVGTVSRAVSEKYMQTPRGIFPLRMFFSGGTETLSGEEMSWRAVQAKLKQIIDAEDASQPFSDDQLVQKLEDQGIRIARRTVAKYRQQLKIPPARRRRQF